MRWHIVRRLSAGSGALLLVTLLAPSSAEVVRLQGGESLSQAVRRLSARTPDLFLPAGEYPVSQPVVLPSGVVLRGAGPATILRVTENSGGLGAIVLDSVSAVTIANLTIDGSAAKNDKLDGIRGTAVTNFRLEGLTIRHCPSRGINLWGRSRDGAIIGCTVAQCGDRGIVLGNADHCRIDSCRAESNGSHGIWLLAGTRFTSVIHNQVRDNHGQGIELFRDCHSCTVAYNDISGNALGIHCFTVQRSLLLGNIIHTNRSNGIDCNDCQQMRIIGNHVERSGSKRTPENAVEGSGILLFRTRDSVVAGNISLDNDQGDSYRSGIQLMDEGDPEHLCARNLIVGNVCFDDQAQPTQRFAMRIGRPNSSCPDNFIVGNHLSRHPDGPFGGNRRGAVEGGLNQVGHFDGAHPTTAPRLPRLTELPPASPVWRGRIVLLAADDEDRVYICRQTKQGLQWCAVDARALD